jgi:hypothetical protein
MSPTNREATASQPQSRMLLDWTHSTAWQLWQPFEMCSTSLCNSLCNSSLFDALCNSSLFDARSFHSGLFNTYRGGTSLLDTSRGGTRVFDSGLLGTCLLNTYRKRTDQLRTRVLDARTRMFNSGLFRASLFNSGLFRASLLDTGVFHASLCNSSPTMLDSHPTLLYACFVVLKPVYELSS